MNTSCNIPSEKVLTVAELAVSQPGAREVFTRYNIDYCCGGHRSLDDACRRIGLDPETIKKEIGQTNQSDVQLTVRPEKWTSALLIDYIIENHHAYVKHAQPEIAQLLDKVCDAHGDETPELERINELFTNLADELASHMSKEELILFPAIKRLEVRRDREDHPLLQNIQAPISAMVHEHDDAGNIVKQIRALSNNYTPPEFACPTFRIAFQKLREFDHDFMRHIHLENNILFKRVRRSATGW